VTDGAGARQTLADLVMAWARDTETGEPRYILELDAGHRGARCGCECPSCGKPLTAVNAAKTEFLRRPHFRHPEGAQRDECLVLAARAAALRQLHEEGWLDLPRRRMSARVAGLSGQFHEAWVEEAPVRIRICCWTVRCGRRIADFFGTGVATWTTSRVKPYFSPEIHETTTGEGEE
jgi:hypothetical protein